jgi:ribosomal protein S24E
MLALTHRPRALPKVNPMNIKIESKKENALLGRQEIVFTLRHDGAATPSRTQVRQLLASEIGTKTENVVIDAMDSEYGLGATTGTARAYKSPEAARATERVHMLKRNQLYIEKPKKEAKPAAEGDKAAAKPAAKKGA